jgi:hypothetical protein
MKIDFLGILVEMEMRQGTWLEVSMVRGVTKELG